MWKNINYKGIDLIVNEEGQVKRLARTVTYSDGRVFNYPEKDIKVQKDKYGYAVINLKDKDKSVHIKIHRLLAMAFIPNPDNLPFVNHKDENPSNNQLSNLEWCTRDYNQSYGTARQRQSVSRSIPIEQYDLNGNFIKEWLSGAEIERQLGYTHSMITRCCRNKCKKAFGYIWRYKSVA